MKWKGFDYTVCTNMYIKYIQGLPLTSMGENTGVQISSNPHCFLLDKLEQIM
jgi:hypothetical protein